MAVGRPVPNGFETAETSVQQWRRALVGWVGVPAAEVAGRVRTLATFCTAAGTSSQDLLAAARADLAAVLTAAEEQGAGLVVQSFLIHNGLNVFGAIVCMPRTADQLAEQDERWVPRRPRAAPEGKRQLTQRPESRRS